MKAAGYWRYWCSSNFPAGEEASSNTQIPLTRLKVIQSKYTTPDASGVMPTPLEKLRLWIKLDKMENPVNPFLNWCRAAGGGSLRALKACLKPRKKRSTGKRRMKRGTVIKPNATGPINFPTDKIFATSQYLGNFDEFDGLANVNATVKNGNCSLLETAITVDANGDWFDETTGMVYFGLLFVVGLLATIIKCKFKQNTCRRNKRTSGHNNNNNGSAISVVTESSPRNNAGILRKQQNGPTSTTGRPATFVRNDVEETRADGQAPPASGLDAEFTVAMEQSLDNLIQQLSRPIDSGNNQLAEVMLIEGGTWNWDSVDGRIKRAIYFTVVTGPEEEWGTTGPDIIGAEIINADGGTDYVANAMRIQDRMFRNGFPLIGRLQHRPHQPAYETSV